MLKALTLAVAGLLAAFASAPASAEQPGMSLKSPASAFEFEFTSIDGAKMPLSAYRGHPVLVVNTASFCGFTPQYSDLEALWQRYRDRGFVLIGVPSNDFGQQEPGSPGEIKKFCETNYSIDFPLTEKQRVTGSDAHPFYRWIAEQLGEDGVPHWNFYKYLIAPDGSLAGLWPSRVRPTDKAVTEKIEPFLTK
jgi:glutathione peroxidase